MATGVCPSSSSSSCNQDPFTTETEDGGLQFARSSAVSAGRGPIAQPLLFRVWVLLLKQGIHPLRLDTKDSHAARTHNHLVLLDQQRRKINLCLLPSTPSWQINVNRICTKYFTITDHIPQLGSSCNRVDSESLSVPDDPSPSSFSAVRLVGWLAELMIIIV